MNLAKFLELSIEENLQQKKIEGLQKISNRAVFYNAIIRYKVPLLLKLAIVNPEINKICNAPELNDYWSELWRKSGLNPNEQAEKNHKSVQEYLPMPTISCLDLLKGHFLYEAYQAMIQKKEISDELVKEAAEYLSRSAEYGSYFALNALCKNGLALLESEFDPEIAIKVIYYANLAAKFYLSPGYLLLGNVYQELLLYKNQKLFEGTNLPLLAMQAIIIANKLEDFSIPMINNAYQGKTLLEASDGKIKNFSQALYRLQDFLKLNSTEVESAYKSATIEANNIKIKLNANSSDLLELDNLNDSNSETVLTSQVTAIIH